MVKEAISSCILAAKDGGVQFSWGAGGQAPRDQKVSECSSPQAKFSHSLKCSFSHNSKLEQHLCI